jgi:recombination protein RecA
MAKIGETRASSFSPDSFLHLADSTPLRRASELATRHKEQGYPPLEVPALPLLADGVVRGAITEIVGLRSSGRVACLLHVLAQATQRGETCMMVDTQGYFDPVSAYAASVRLDHLGWVRCQGRVDHALRAVDLLLHAGGFGVVVLDLCETPLSALEQIPLSSWFRFRRALQNTPTILLVLAEHSLVRSCPSFALTLEPFTPEWTGDSTFCLLKGARVHGALRKPAVGPPVELLLTGWSFVRRSAPAFA